MATKIAINGFGRIGRCVLRAALSRKENLDFVAINDLDEPAALAHLFKYDSVHGTWQGTVKATDKAIIIDGKEIAVTAQKDPTALPWKSLGADIVLECTGRFTERDDAAKHMGAGAKKVIISAPAKGPDLTLAYGINHDQYDPKKHHILSNASCTTNCLAPLGKVLLENFGIEKGVMTTIHSYTNDQRILDLTHKDLRRARAAALSMIPASTGAAKAIGEVLPALKGKMNGQAVRVPTPNVSLVDLTVVTSKSVTVDAVNAAFKAAAEGPLKGILQYSDELTVSVDYNGNPHSSIFDSTNTMVMGDNLLKVMAWYDNEWGFSNRMVDTAKFLASKGL
ncbi:glyceraldehyde 3-phosphate dehydrogenase [Archangium gephyra]|uniref:Glyceraldehyde-3-phosphate dehydrogenase n=1 Tax=Archangium gephyra TaxID=48 RepID=A0AAC8TGH0_9BACT|nr:type I glyceraldehyde-3-phosphate dehydrogenase [Archangium gephyra]AKJ05202.1 NAD-dependent glyceraldehyde-3-phosphate dehydrogenase [Archangium gephyra]REG35896.1 glyceraldehyde 3-phosphate dehydrogenase [Archangium gephyra]